MIDAFERLDSVEGKVSELSLKVNGIISVEVPLTFGKSYNENGYVPTTRWCSTSKQEGGTIKIKAINDRYKYQVYSYISDTQGEKLVDLTSNESTLVSDKSIVVSVRRSDNDYLTEEDKVYLSTIGVAYINPDSIDEKLKNLEDKVDDIHAGEIRDDVTKLKDAVEGKDVKLLVTFGSVFQSNGYNSSARYGHTDKFKGVRFTIPAIEDIYQYSVYEYVSDNEGKSIIAWTSKESYIENHSNLIINVRRADSAILSNDDKATIGNILVARQGIKDTLDKSVLELQGLSSAQTDINLFIDNTAKDLYEKDIEPVLEEQDGAINRIFTIPNFGVRADSSKVDFGELVSMDGFYCSDFIPYEKGTDVKIKFTSRYSSFGFVFYDKYKRPITENAVVFSDSLLNTEIVISSDKASYFRSSSVVNGYLKYMVDNSGSKTRIEKIDFCYQHLGEEKSRWNGKTILFIGTSIPGGGYPQIACEILGAKCINNAVGSSVLRKALRDGGGFTQFDPSESDSNYCKAFTATKQEKESLFGNSNYNKYSFEELLMPYLNGTNPMPDLFVIDYSSDDKTRTGKNDPYFAQMNTNSNAVLPADYQLAPDGFTAQKGVLFNRNSYTGAMSFIIDLIYQYNPFARIILIGFQNEQLRARMCEAQRVVAAYWQLPILELSKKIGWSQRVITGSKEKFNIKYAPTYTTDNDVNVMRMWCPDGIHPSSNPTMLPNGYKESNYEIAKIVASFIESI